MTDGITLDKIGRVAEVIEQLNKEIRPLMVKAVLLDPMMLKAPMSVQTRHRVIADMADFVFQLMNVVNEQQRKRTYEGRSCLSVCGDVLEE